ESVVWRLPVVLLWAGRIRGGGVPAFSAAADFPQPAALLLDVRHSAVDPGGYRGGDHFRRRVRDATKEEDPGVDRNAVRPRRDPAGRSQRSNQRAAARGPGHWPGLVPAGHAAHDADLLA